MHRHRSIIIHKNGWKYYRSKIYTMFPFITYHIGVCYLYLQEQPEGAIGDDKAKESAQCYIRKLTSEMEKILNSHNVFLLHLMTSGKDFIKVTGDCEPKWVKPEQMLCALQDKEKEPGDEISKEGTQSVANILHQVADGLPYLGCSLSVVLLLDSTDIDSHNSFIPLAGALRRLTEWHNAQLTIVKLEADLSDLALSLSEFVQCIFSDHSDSMQFYWPRWSGKVAVKNCIGKRVASAIKKKVESTPPIFGRTIEILQEVDVRSVPVFLCDLWTFELKLFEGYSNVLMEYMSEMRESGLLARLRVYPNNGKTCGDLAPMTTAAWKERVLTNYYNLRESEEEEVLGKTYFLYFLLLPPRHTTSMSSSESSSSSLPSIQAKVLLSPFEINRDIVQLVEDEITNCACERDAETDDRCGNLPVMGPSKFRLVLEALSDHDRQLDERFKEGSSLSEQEELLMQLGQTREEILKLAFDDCQTLNSYSKLFNRLSKEEFISTPSTEALLELSQFPEKRALCSRDSSTRKLGRSLSMESVPNLVMEEEEQKTSQDLTVLEILEMLKKSGQSLDPQCGTTKLKDRKLCHVDNHSDVSLAWPESQSLQHFDVYYNNSEDAVKLERRYAKIRDKGYFDERRSSFNSPVKKRKSQATRDVSSPRWSPRPSVSAGNLTGSIKDALRRYRSSRDTSGLRDELFKQPAARKHSGSPSKRTSLPMATSTPDYAQFQRHCSRKRMSSSGISSDDISQIVRKSPRKHPPSSLSSNLHASRPQNKIHTQTPSLKRTTPVKKTVHRPQSHCRSPGKKYASLPESLSVYKLSTSKSECLQLNFGEAMDSKAPVRRSPRKHKKDLTLCVSESGTPDRGRVSQQSRTQGLACTSGSAVGAGDSQVKMKRSDRHKLKLKKIIETAMEKKGIEKGSSLHAACTRNLFNVSMVLLKTLPNSQNLTEEMKTVVYGQVQQIINLEKRRSGIAI